MNKRMKKKFKNITFTKRVKTPNGHHRTVCHKVPASEVIHKQYLELVAHSAKHIIAANYTIEETSYIEKMNILLDTLREVDIEENIKESTRDDAEYPCYINWPDENIHDIIESLCCDLFIDNNGNPNMANIQIFNNVLQSDYYVGPGEQDGFGWLTGVITTSDSSLLMLVFG